MSWPGTSSPSLVARAGWPGTATASVDHRTAVSTVPQSALTFNNLEPIQFSDGTYLELAA